MKKTDAPTNAKRKPGRPHKPKSEAVPIPAEVQSSTANFDALEQPRACTACGGTDLSVLRSRAENGISYVDVDAGCSGWWRIRVRRCAGCGFDRLRTITPLDDAAKNWAYHNRRVHFAGAPEALAQVAASIKGDGK